MISRRIYAFGTLRVQDPNGLRRVSGEKVQSLLAYLILHPRTPHRREMLAELLSPDALPERVLRNFSDTLYRLQKALSPAWLAVDSDSVALVTGPELWVDVWEFEKLAASEQEEDLQKAVALYTGDLLPEIDAGWMDAERELFRGQYMNALEMLAKTSEAQGKLQQALLHTRRIILSDPLHEPAHQAYLRLLGRLNRFGEALAHFDYLCQLLRDELDAEPLAETRAIIQALEREHALAVTPIGVEEHTAFIGRIPERAAALASVEAALEGRGGILAIEGEAGMGKSRLLSEILAGAAWRGAAVLRGGTSQVPGVSPFSPLDEALFPFLSSARAIQLEAALPDEVLSTLAALFPSWRTQKKPRQPVDGRNGRQLQDALRFFGEALARMTPLVLALDDMHWADPVLWESLNSLSQGLVHNGALLLLVYRRPAIEATPGWEILKAWDRAGLLKAISLQPFGLAEVTQMIGDQPGVNPAEIYALSGGNPFQISEWLADPSHPLSGSHPAMARRLKSLSPPALAALRAAAVLGENIPLRQWAKTCALSPLDLAGLSEELAGQHWLKISTQGYSFVHDLIRSAVYDELKPTERRLLHGRAVQAYQELEPENARVLAFHLDQAGQVAEAALAFRRAGEQDQARFAFREAQAAYDRALALMVRTPTPERIQLDIALARVCEVTGDQLRQHTALDEALAGAQQLGDEALVLQALRAAGRASSRGGRYPEAETQLNAALALAQKLQDPSSEAETLHFLGDLSGMQGKWEAARGLYLRALTVARAIPEPAREANAMRGLAISARQMGDLQEAAGWLERAQELNRKIGDRLGEIMTQTNILSILYELGAWDRLIAVADQAIPEAQAMGILSSLVRMRQNRGIAAWALGDYTTARELLLQSERDSEAGGDPRMAAVARNCLGLVAEDEGNFQEALHLYRSTLADFQGLKAGTEAAYAQHDLGALLLNLGEPSEAIPLLASARATWAQQENLLLRIKSEAFLGLALLATAERERAKELAETGWAVFQEGVPQGEKPQSWLWALSRLLAALGQTESAGEVLRAAYEELQRQALAIQDANWRRSFFERVPLNHEIITAYEQSRNSGSGVIWISLARRDAPLGRALNENEKIMVRWTVNAPEDAALSDKTGLRRQRIKRLFEQAEIQGAAATDDDLARALSVSRRTILRDLQAMAHEMETPPTRKRKRK